jgi:hypothetical protein
MGVAQRDYILGASSLLSLMFDLTHIRRQGAWTHCFRSQGNIFCKVRAKKLTMLSWTYSSNSPLFIIGL